MHKITLKTHKITKHSIRPTTQMEHDLGLLRSKLKLHLGLLINQYKHLLD